MNSLNTVIESVKKMFDLCNDYKEKALLFTAKR